MELEVAHLEYGDAADGLMQRKRERSMRQRLRSAFLAFMTGVAVDIGRAERFNQQRTVAHRRHLRFLRKHFDCFDR